MVMYGFMLVSLNRCSLPQHYPAQLECLSMHLFCLLVLTLIVQPVCQFVHAHQCPRVLSTRSLTHFPEMKDANLMLI
jgi:hypothetical protein